MNSDLDIFRTTSVIIRKHRGEADMVAAMRADNFLENGEGGQTSATTSARARR
jgi:hypothetical protein